MAEPAETSTAAALEVITGRRASLSGKRELMEKLKKALGAGKAVKHQRESAHSLEHETLRIQTETQQQELGRKHEQTHDMAVLPHDVIDQCQALQRRVDEKESALQVAQSQVEAFQMELELQRDVAVKKQQQDATTIQDLTQNLEQTLDRLGQEETRVLVLQEENHRLVTQLDAILQEKQQQERDAQRLRNENETLASKVDDLMAQLMHARQQQEDTEARYLDVSSKCNQVLGEKEEWMKATDSVESRDAAECVRNMETQLAEWKTEVAATTNEWALEKHELTQEIESLRIAQEKATTAFMQVAQLQEQNQSIESLLEIKTHEIQVLTAQLAATKTLEDNTIDNTTENAVEIETPTSPSLADTKQLQIALETTTQQDLGNQKFGAVIATIETFVADLQRVKAADCTNEVNTFRLAELETYLSNFIEHVSSGVHPSKRQEQAERLEERALRYEVENRLLSAKLEECELALKAHVEKYSGRGGLDMGSDTEQCASSGDDAGSVVSNSEPNGSDGGCELERQIVTLKARIHAAEAEMVACKAENLRLVFQVAQTVDSAAKLKQDYEAQLLTRREKRKLAPLDVAMEGVASDSYLQRRLEALAMQGEEFRCVICSLQNALMTSNVENRRLTHDLEVTRTEKDVLETRLTDLHAVANRKVETDEWQKKDREVEELRSSLVQAKVNFLDQKQQLTALEKKLVDVSKSKSSTCAVSNASLDAERREYEAALIEMIDMEKKLQVAYEAKQGLESTLKERLEAKADLEERLSVAEDKIAELEQQLEQKIALIATIEEQLQSVDQERDRLADKLARTKSKLERSRGKLEEKVIEFEAFKTTTNMLKDERSRLFNEIALLKDKIEKSEVQKAAMANSQELANEELNDQLNELADKIAELEAEKQELGARLEETVYRSEEDIHQLKERLYMLEAERSSMEEENQNLEKTMERLEEQKAHLEAANTSTSHQVSLLTERMETASSELATLSSEKATLLEVQQSLERKVRDLEDENVKLAQMLQDTTAELREEVNVVRRRAETLETQLIERTSEKNRVAADLLALEQRSQVEDAAREKVAAKLETQNKELEHKLQALKQMAQKALQSLQTESGKLVEAEKRVEKLEDERDKIRTVLHEKETGNEALRMQREELLQHVATLMTQVEYGQDKMSKDARAAEATIDRLTRAEAALTESVESLRRDLMEAESCVMVLVEERDEAKKTLTAKELMIEMLTAQQGELALAVQKRETELKTLRSKRSAETEAHEEMIGDLEKAKKTVDTLQESLRRTETSLELVQAQLGASELRVAKLEEERDVARNFLTEKESSHERLSAVQEDLQQKVCALELELRALRETSAAELAAAKETITSLERSKEEAAATLACVRHELVEAEECVMVLVGERDAAKKILSQRELALEVLSSEHGELQLQSQSMMTELETLKRQGDADALAADKVAQALKEDVDRITRSFELAQEELVEAQGHVASLSAQQEAACKSLNDIETERGALRCRNEELEKDMEHLQVKVQSLESELQELQSQRESDAGSAEKTTRSLKEMAETLETAREKLTEAEARAVCAEEGHEAALKALGEMKSQSEAQSTEVERLQERIQSLESELQELQSQRESDAETAEKTKDHHGAELATKDEIISTLKSKLEEVMAAYKRLKGHVKHVQDKLTHETAKNDRLTTSLEALKAQDVALAAELEAVQVELAASRAQSSVLSEESRQQSERAAEAVAQYEAQIELLMKRVSVSDEELAQTRRQHAIEAQEQKETFQSALAQKDAEIERLIHDMQRVEDELAHAHGAREEAGRAHEAERKEWKLQCVAELETQRTCLERQAQAETERAQAALAALETYKKRAHCALKKTSRESKQQVSDAVARTSELQRELDAATSCITGLESELKDARRCLEEEAARRGELASVQAEVTRLNDALARMETPLRAQITELTARNDALEQRVRVTEDERRELACQLQAAVESGRRSLSPTDSPSEKERRSTASSSRSFDFEGSVPTLLHPTIEEHDAVSVGIDSTTEVTRLRTLLEEMELKYQDALAEATRQQQQCHELEKYATQAVNMEYLKNVILKYMASQVPGEKLQLVPVVATLLSFSPHEQHQVLAAHEESAGVLGGVFSLFGKASTSPMKALAVPPSFKPSSTSNGRRVALASQDRNGVLAFGDACDDDELTLPLNPFAA